MKMMAEVSTWSARMENQAARPDIHEAAPCQSHGFFDHVWASVPAWRWRFLDSCRAEVGLAPTCRQPVLRCALQSYSGKWVVCVEGRVQLRRCPGSQKDWRS